METTRNVAQDGVHAFPETHWTRIFEAGSGDSERARAALEELCALYRRPIVRWFGRHVDKQDAEDLAHDFVGYLLAKEVLAGLVEKKGKFRFFLVTVMRRFLYNKWAKASAQKRGSNSVAIPLAADEPNPTSQGDSQFDLDLALEIHERVMKQLGPPTELCVYLFNKDPNAGWGGIAATLKTTSMALRQKVSRLRRAHWECFREEVAQMVSPAEKADETRYLYELLFRNLPVSNPA